MPDLAELYQQHAAHLPEPARREVAAFGAKLGTFVHAPTTFKEASRLEKFSRLPQLVDMVARVLPQYQPWTRLHYDIIGYWYSVALLSLARDAGALAALADLTTAALAAGWEGLDLLRRNYSFFPLEPALAAPRAAVEQYFQQLAPQVEALAWATQIGLQLPAAAADWTLSFELATDGEKKFAFQLTPAEKQQRLTLTVSAHGAPRGDGQSWDIRFGNHDNSTAGQFYSSHDRTLRRHNQLLTLPVAPSLLSFGEFLRALEAAVGARFQRKIVFSYFSKGLRNKGAVAQWLATIGEAP